MRLLKSVFDFYINSSIHVALAVYALSWITLLEFDLSYSEAILYFIFYSSITGYNFVKYFGVARFHHRSLTDSLKVIQVFSGICFLAMCYYGFKLKGNALYALVILAFITYLYALPLSTKLINISKKNLRSISGLKVYVVALVWTAVTVFLPLLNEKFPLSLEVYITAFQRFLFVLILMLPFEIRDMQYDSLKLHTIPQKIGVKQTKILGLILIAFFFFSEFLKDELDTQNTIVLSVIAIICVLAMLFSSEKQTKYYSSFWVESIPIVWLLLTLVFR